MSFLDRIHDWGQSTGEVFREGFSDILDYGVEIANEKVRTKIGGVEEGTTSDSRKTSQYTEKVSPTDTQTVTPEIQNTAVMNPTYILAGVAMLVALMMVKK